MTSTTPLTNQQLADELRVVRDRAIQDSQLVAAEFNVGAADEADTLREQQHTTMIIEEAIHRLVP